MAADFTRSGAELSDLQAAYRDRLSEANELYSLGWFGTAMALGMYALEIYLKVRICQRLDLDQLPKAFETHDLEGLLVLAGLKRRMDATGSLQVKANWCFLTTPPVGTQHVNDLRYKPSANWFRSDCEHVLHSIQDPDHGVLTWLFTQS